MLDQRIWIPKLTLDASVFCNKALLSFLEAYSHLDANIFTSYTLRPAVLKTLKRPSES